MSFPKPMEEDTFWILLLDFSFITSSSLEMSPDEPIFFAFFLLWRGGSFLGKANMGKMTRSMAMEHKRKPLHLQGIAGEGGFTQEAHVWRGQGSCEGALVCLPVADKARVTLVDVDDSFGVDVEADEDASQEVASCWTQGSHHVHDGWRRHFYQHQLLILMFSSLN